MRIDAHQHFWNYNPEEYWWITDEMASIRNDYLPGDLVPLLKSIGFEGAIVVQARTTLEETEWLVALAERHDFIKGVVGWVDLKSPEVESILARYPIGSPLKGVRYMSDSLDDRLDRGMAALGRRGLTCDLLIHPPDISAAIAMASRYPEQRFVVDHIAKPAIKEGRISPWSRDIEDLAELDNVWCKLSGMVFEADWRRWAHDDFTPYLDIVFDAFGTDRLMIGSNWPVCLVAGEYKPVMKIVIDYMERLPSEAAEKILGETCAKFYTVSD